MKTLLANLFVANWQRKTVSLILSIIIWLVVNHSLTSTKTLANIPVRVINIPQGKTVEGLQSNSKLNRKLSLTLVGNTNTLDELTSNDLEIIIDAANKPDEWIATISKKNLVSLNPEIDISKGISRVYHPSFILRMTKVVTEKIPIAITRPIGEPPRGYQFLDIWPYRLTLTVSGPEDVIKRLKLKEQKLTFNLNDISKAQLDALSSASDKSDVVSFFVPDPWKQINIPLLSDVPIEIDDPLAKTLRIDFARCNLLPLDSPIVVTSFFPPEYSRSLNPTTLQIATNSLISCENGIYMIKTPLYAKGVDALFLQIVKEMIQIVIIATPPSQRQFLPWSIQFVNPNQLEDKYVSALMSDTSDEDIRLMRPSLREEYLRNRFRSYMNHFQLFYPDDSRFDLTAKIQGHSIEIQEPKIPSP